MPAEFSRSQVEKIAALAHLQLDAAEVDLFARQLADILEYANQVQQIDTSGVPPTTSVAGRDVDHKAERPDEVQPSLAREEALSNAPDAAPEAGLFKVPRVIG